MIQPGQGLLGKTSHRPASRSPVAPVNPFPNEPDIPTPAPAYSNPCMAPADFFGPYARQLQAANAVALAQAEQARRELGRRSTLGLVKLFNTTYDAGWCHIEIAALLDAFVEAVERKLSPRLMIFLPPRAGKSELVSRIFPAFCFGLHPEWEVISATYGQDLADDFGFEVRRTLNDPLYAELFPSTQIDPSSNAKDRITTTNKGGYRAVGVGGPLTGRGAHVMLIDDPLKGRAEADSELEREKLAKWYFTVARTRLAPGGGIILCQTRWHEDDLAGRLLATAAADPVADQWKVYSYPALAERDEKHRRKGQALHPSRFDESAYAKLKASYIAAGQVRDWNALYQQNPIPDEGNFFRREDFQTYKITDLPKNGYWYIATDFAVGTKTGNDYTVLAPFMVAENGDVYFSHKIVRERLDPLSMVERLLDLAKEFKPMYIAIEKGVISHAIMPTLNKRMDERGQYHSLWEKTPAKDKQTRATPLKARMQAKKIWFPDVSFFHDTWQPEMLAFPAGKNDDMVDAPAWGALMLDELVAPAPPPAPPEPAAEADTWEEIQSRIPTKNSRTHRPQSLFAHVKKRRFA